MPLTAAHDRQLFPVLKIQKTVVTIHQDDSREAPLPLHSTGCLELAAEDSS